jgi:hypothetical protein
MLPLTQTTRASVLDAPSFCHQRVVSFLDAVVGRAKLILQTSFVVRLLAAKKRKELLDAL